MKKAQDMFLKVLIGYVKHNANILNRNIPLNVEDIYVVVKAKEKKILLVSSCEKTLGQFSITFITSRRHCIDDMLRN